MTKILVDRELLLATLSHIRWAAFGECRTEGYDKPIPPPLTVTEMLEAALTQPQSSDEPVAIYRNHRLTPEGTSEFWGTAEKRLPPNTKLYTKPQRQEWVGLDEEVVSKESGAYTESEGFVHGAYWAEEQLKEKNGGQ